MSLLDQLGVWAFRLQEAVNLAGEDDKMPEKVHSDFGFRF